MSYQVESINGCTKKIVFNFESLDLSTEIKNELIKKQKTVNLKGFRKGKAPLSVVEQMYRPQVESDALNSFIQNQLYEAITKEELQVVGSPNFENMKYDPSKSVSFDAVVEIFPEVEVSDMSGLSFSKDKVVVEDSDVEDVKKNYLNSKAEMVEVKDEGQTLDKGLFAVMNFQGEMPSGEKPENMKGEEFLLEIGSGQFIPGFEDQMVGMKKGDKKTIEVTFPENYQAVELQNELVKFEIELLEIKEKNYPDFTEELAKEFGYDSVEDFTVKNKKTIENQRDKASKQKLNQEILEKLVEQNKFDIPNSLVFQQTNHLKEDMKRTLSQQGFNDEMMKEYFEKWKDDLNEKAQFQVRSGLILDALAKEYSVESSEEDYNAKLKEVAETSGLEIDQIKGFYEKDQKMKNNLMYAIREEKTFEKIYEKVEIKES